MPLHLGVRLGWSTVAGRTEVPPTARYRLAGRCRLTVPRPVLKAPMGSAPETKFGQPVSTVAFKFNLRRYSLDLTRPDDAAFARRLVGAAIRVGPGLGFRVYGLGLGFTCVGLSDVADIARHAMGCRFHSRNEGSRRGGRAKAWCLLIHVSLLSFLGG